MVVNFRNGDKKIKLYTFLALWKHHVKFSIVSCKYFDPQARIFISANNAISIISTDEDPSLRIESFAIINLRGVSPKLNKYIVFTMQTYKEIKLYLSILFIFFQYKNI